MKYKLEITAWYFNQERSVQLINPQNFISKVASLKLGLENVDEYWREFATRNLIIQEFSEWLHSNKIPTLAELLIKKPKLNNGDLFSIYHDFYGNGLGKFQSSNAPNPQNMFAEVHNRLRYNPDVKLRILYHPDNFICKTAWSRLSGHTRLFCVCYVENFESNVIIARPYIMGDLHDGPELQTTPDWPAKYYGEIQPFEIDQFKKVHEFLKSAKIKSNIKALRDIPEVQIKHAFAEIIQEPDVPKDWGGEKSDLFTTKISVDGKFMSTAFIFKGPARFSPMTMKHLGQNGDQIERLFTEPANLLILQHCHNVTNPVRATMRAYASSLYNPRHFSIIDGTQTYQILSAYGKCGLGINKT